MVGKPHRTFRQSRFPREKEIFPLAWRWSRPRMKCVHGSARICRSIPAAKWRRTLPVVGNHFKPYLLQLLTCKQALRVL